MRDGAVARVRQHLQVGPKLGSIILCTLNKKHEVSADISLPCLPRRSYLGVSSYNQRPAIIMKYYRRGSLEQEVRQAGGYGLPLEQALRWAAVRMGG